MVRGRAVGGQSGTVRLGARLVEARTNLRSGKQVFKEIPKIDPSRFLELTLPAASEPVEIYGTLPVSLGAAPGRALELVVVTSREVELEGLGLVPLADELPPPPPRPWHATEAAMPPDAGLP
jgi:hypothetical protein